MFSKKLYHALLLALITLTQYGVYAENTPENIKIEDARDIAEVLPAEQLTPETRSFEEDESYFDELLASYISDNKAVIFDIHGVLLKENLKQHVKNKVEQILAEQQGDTRSVKDARPYLLLVELMETNCPCCDDQACQHKENDSKFPHCVYQFFAGKITSEVLHTKLRTLVANHTFDNPMDQLMVTGLVEAIFDREQLMDSIIPVNEGHILLQMFAKNGTFQENHATYILSNAPTEWIDYERAAFPEVFKLLEDTEIMTSSEAGSLKPEASCFQYALDKHNLQPADVVLIDDTQANVDGAKAMGMNAVYFDFENIEETLSELCSLSILAPADVDIALAAMENNRTPIDEIEKTFF